MSWTRHLYDPVGAIARDLTGRDRRPMTPDEITRQRTLGTRRFGADDGRPAGGAGRGYAEREPGLAPGPRETPMAKPMPVLADPGPGKGPAAAPVTTGATARYAGPAGSGVAAIPSANGGLQVGPADGGLAPGRRPGPPVGPLPGQPGNAHTARVAAGEIPQDPQVIAAANAAAQRMRDRRTPVMSAPPVTPAPSPGRYARRPRP